MIYNDCNYFVRKTGGYTPDLGIGDNLVSLTYCICNNIPVNLQNIPFFDFFEVKEVHFKSKVTSIYLSISCYKCI